MAKILLAAGIVFAVGSYIAHEKYLQAEADASVWRPGETIVIGGSKFKAPGQTKAIRNLLIAACLVSVVGALGVFLAARKEKIQEQ